MVKITKTMGPIHFEDLDPHRFEDLIREIIYSLKTWQNIEATGRSGSDEGFDIRAWEKNEEITNRDEEDEENVGVHPMEGNLWMIQGKREKELGPTAVKKIINDGVNKKSPPYGYILAAPVNFSKKSYDIFREVLRKKGVMEFYLWGRAELEDMLHQPKNDHILFTFFGVSLVARRKSKTTEKKFPINNKNKLLRILSSGEYHGKMHQSILIRDFQDENYPWEEKYKDFSKSPRWQEHIVTEYHPHGLMIDVSERYAYVDHEKKVWDYTKAIDLINRGGDVDDFQKRQQQYKNKEDVEDFWKHLPKKNQSKLLNKGIILFKDILIIDDKGDVVNKYPHIFLEFQYNGEPFRAMWHYLTDTHSTIDLEKAKYKKIKFFPNTFPKPKKGKVYKDKSVELNEETRRLLRIGTGVIESDLFDIDGKYDFLNPRDSILINGVDGNKEPNLLKIMYKYKTTVENYLSGKDLDENKANIERQVGRAVKNTKELNVLEFELTYSFGS